MKTRCLVGTIPDRDGAPGSGILGGVSLSRHLVSAVDAVETVLCEYGRPHAGGRADARRRMAERLTIPLLSRGSVRAADIDEAWAHECGEPLSVRRPALEVAALTRAVNAVPGAVVISRGAPPPA